MPSRDLLVRELKLTMELTRRPRGASVPQLARALRVSRATLYRDLKFLIERVGLPIQKRVVSGEARYSLEETSSVVLEASPLQIAALRIARQALAPLDGTRLVRELDRLLGAYGRRRSAVPPPYLERGDGGAPAAPPEIVATLDEALRRGRRVRLVYRAASRGGAAATHRVDPLVLRWVDETLYLYGYSQERRAGRVFKVARVGSAELLEEAAEAHPELDVEQAFKGSVKAWTGALARVRVRLAPEVAWLASEYPLLQTQRLTPARDGSVVVEAETAGEIEARRWAMSWGRHAEVLEPASLREAVTAELAAMAAVYARGSAGGG